MRNLPIDLLKSVLVLLVVLGHCIQYVYLMEGLSFDDNFIFKFIYSFHMPLFFFISGFLFKPNFCVRKKFELLIIPFFFWGVINYLNNDFEIPFQNYIYEIILNPIISLWFLWALFIIMCLSSIIFRCLNVRYMVFFPFAMLFFSLILKKYGYGYQFGLDLVFWYLPFFSLGFWFNNYSDKITPLNSKIMTPILGIVFFIFLNFWCRTSTDSSIINVVLYLFVKMASALVVVFIVMFNMNRFSFSNRFVVYISRHALHFYVTQFLVISFLINSGASSITDYIVINVSLTFLFCILLCVAAIELLKLNSITRKLAFGR